MLVKPAAVWSVPASKDGMQRLPLDLPNELSDNGIWIPNISEFSTTVTPAGTISSWHLDQFHCGTILIMLEGFKLFAICPPIESNLGIFSEIDNFGNLDDVLPKLQRFEQVRYSVLRAGDIAILDPGELHMVLSPVNSVVGGGRCYKKEWRGEAVRLMNWEMKRGYDKETKRLLKLEFEEAMALYDKLEGLKT